MSQSEQIAATFAGLLAGVPLLFVAWRTIVFPHDSPYWPVLIPLGLLVILVITTPLARRADSQFLRALQSAIFFTAFVVGLGVAVAVLVIGYREFTAVPLEEPGLLLMVLTAAFVPACLYPCFVVWIDQRKLARRLLPAWKVLAAAAALPVVFLVAWAALEAVG
jgi:hypothetical protein